MRQLAIAGVTKLVVILWAAAASATAASVACAPSTGSILVGCPGVPDDGAAIPFGESLVTGFQQLYDQSFFSAQPVLIGGLTFFARNSILNSPDHDPNDPNYPFAGNVQPGDYTIHLGVFPHGAILDTNLGNNLGLLTNSTFFFTGHLGGPVDDHFTITSNQSNFLYDPNAGDLLLDITKANPDLPISGQLDFAADPLLNAVFVTTTGDVYPGCDVGCAAYGNGLVTEFELVGQSQSSPILPAIQADGSFLFTDVPSGSWFDPNTVFGFDYIGLLDKNSIQTMFSGLTVPTGFLDPFHLLDANGNVLATLNAGDTFTFSTPVSEFKIVDINPLVDPTDPFAFPIYLQFTNPTGTFSANPLNTPPPANNTPEPATVLMFSGGILALGAVRLLARRP